MREQIGGISVDRRRTNEPSIAGDDLRLTYKRIADATIDTFGLAKDRDPFVEVQPFRPTKYDLTTADYSIVSLGIHTHDGSASVYLDPAEAEALAVVLAQAAAQARDIERAHWRHNLSHSTL